MARRAGERIPQALFLKSATKPSEFPDPQGRPEIAIAGRSNVGKSSLINRFLNQVVLVIDRNVSVFFKCQKSRCCKFVIANQNSLSCNQL